MSAFGGKTDVAAAIAKYPFEPPPEVKEQMFNPSFTTKPPGEGTGLGLSISHDIIVNDDTTFFALSPWGLVMQC